MDHKIQRLNRLETHDRYKHFSNQDFGISKTCEDIVKSRPFGDIPFYIFAHKRTIDNSERADLWLTGKFATLADIPSARLIWQPRLTKPRAQENSMLFKAYPGTDMIKIIWMIPDKALWPSYEEGKMTENEMVAVSITTFKTDPRALDLPEEDDLPEEVIDNIYQQLGRTYRSKEHETKS